MILTQSTLLLTTQNLYQRSAPVSFAIPAFDAVGFWEGSPERIDGVSLLNHTVYWHGQKFQQLPEYNEAMDHFQPHALNDAQTHLE